MSLQVSRERIALSNVCCISALNVNTMSCFRLDEKGVKTTVKNGMYHLTDRRDGITFSKTTKKPSDGLFVAPLLHIDLLSEANCTKHFASDSKSISDPHRSQNIGTASSGTAVRL